MSAVRKKRIWDSPYLYLALIALAIIICDQVAKAIIVAWIPYGSHYEVVPGFFDLVSVRNRGAAFGFLNREDMEWQFWLFLGATLVAVGAVFSLARQYRTSRLMLTGLGLILGGALGNLADRVRQRAVVDYLDFYWADWHWPAFNVADIAICVGVGLVCVASIFGRRGERT